MDNNGEKAHPCFAGLAVILLLDVNGDDCVGLNLVIIYEEAHLLPFVDVCYAS